MTSELGLNAYILLGNALHHLVNRVPIDSEGELHTPAPTIAALYHKLEPLKPAEILPAVAAMAPEGRSLLARCCRYCLRTMDEGEIGLPREVAEDVLTQLALESASNA